MQPLVIAFTILLTISAYIFCRYLYFKYNNPLLNIVLLSTILVIATLLICKIPYEAYVAGQNIMTFLLGPATVALAVPLYRNKHLLEQYAISIITGVASGTIASMVLALFITQAGGLPREVVISIIPKSATIPFAVEVARIGGGEPSLAVAFVVATGTLGSVIGLNILNFFKISNPVSRGLAMGTVSHGQGTAMALVEGEEQGSMAGVAMALAGIFTSILAPFFISFFVV